MIKSILNRILKPEFVQVGSILIKTSLINHAHANYDNNTIIVSIEDENLDGELFTIQCDSKEHTLKTFKQAFSPFFNG